MNQILLFEFLNLMEVKKWKKADLAKHSGIHISDISRVFNNKKHLSLHYLDALNKAFGLDEGAFYGLYTQLCFNQNRYLDKRRSVAFIYKCAVNGFKEELEYMIQVMLEEKSKTIRTKNLQNLFHIAEKLFLEGKEQEALPLYEIIIQHMPEATAEEVAISYFRKYYVNRLTDEGPATLVHVLEYVSYMPADYQELTFLWISATYYMLKDWDKVYHYAKRLEKIASLDEHYGYALVYQGFALTRLSPSLEDVLTVIDKYEKVNQYFAEIAIGNRYVARIDFGELEYADEYYEWLKYREDLCVGLPRILEAFVKMGRFECASQLLKRHEKELCSLANSSNLYQQQLYLDICYATALLKCEMNDYSNGLNELLDVAVKVKNAVILEKFKKCLLAIWHYRKHLTDGQDDKYTNMLSDERIHYNLEVTNV